MTTALTFQIGKRPGVVRRPHRCRKPTFGLNGAQRVALSELVRGRGGAGVPAPQSNRASVDFIWFAVLALVLVLSGRTLYEGVRSVHAADAMHAVKGAQPQVDVTITRLTPSTEALHADAPVHSSAAASRTM
jgi:hypothetical protein